MSTPENLLDAAEQLFAQQGIASSSLRDITAAAGANLAAVNYHFGNKDGLLRAVLVRRAAPLHAERERLLALAETAAGDHPPTVRAILQAFLDPMFRMLRECPHFPAVMGRVLMENWMPVVGEVFRETFHDTLARFGGALARALPAVPTEEIAWRLLFTVGVCHFVNCSQSAFPEALKSAPLDAIQMTERVIGFCEAGLRSAVAETRFDSTLESLGREPGRGRP
ncbi:MAG: TetR/AcrR family transcriptional regulator [Planctomycetota bacterium]